MIAKGCHMNQVWKTSSQCFNIEVVPRPLNLLRISMIINFVYGCLISLLQDDTIEILWKCANLYRFYQIRNLDQALMLTSVNKCDTIDSIEALNLNNIQKIKSKYIASKNERPFSKIKDLGRRWKMFLIDDHIISILVYVIPAVIVDIMFVNRKLIH